LFGVQPVPTVGFGWGDVTLANFLGLHHLMPELPPETDVYVVLIGEVDQASQQPITELRELGICVAVDLTRRKIGDQLKVADKKGILYALIIGETELAENKFVLKDLKTGSEDKLSIPEIAEKLSSRNSK
jgi:histidyl-tRNA synthetase